MVVYIRCMLVTKSPYWNLDEKYMIGGDIMYEYNKKKILLKELERIIFKESFIDYPKKILPTVYNALQSDLNMRSKHKTLGDYRSIVDALYAMKKYKVSNHNKIRNNNLKQKTNEALLIVDNSDKLLLFRLKILLVQDTPLDDIIIELKDPELSYVYAKTIKHIDIKPFGEIILNSQNPMWNYRFMQDIKGADKDAHKEVILNSNDLYYKKLILSNNDDKSKSI